MKQSIWLIGAGQMAIDYAKILLNLKIPFQVIGRGEVSAINFHKKTGMNVIEGGLDKFLTSSPVLPTHVIVATGVEELGSVTTTLLHYGVKNILIEKPGGIDFKEIENNDNLARLNSAQVFVAYNRRFYASVLAANKIIEQDGGVKSFFFEFTEWSHLIQDMQKTSECKENWFLGNSSHVVDLAFYLGGCPKEISCYTQGSLSWHHRSSSFAGAGRSDKNALFSYIANWNAPGRWGIEIMTEKHRLIFRPLEKLSVMNIGSVNIESINIDDSLDVMFKPGLYLQTKAFLEQKYDSLLSLGSHSYIVQKYYLPISSYSK